LRECEFVWSTVVLSVGIHAQGCTQGLHLFQGLGSMVTELVVGAIEGSGVPEDK
jgi:hypothetical protein